VRLSIIMPNYNHGQFLRSRIESILEQLTDEDELVVVDDASTDESASIIGKYASKDSRVRLIQNGQNMGPAKSANIAIEHAKGEYVAWLASDDIMLPGFVKQNMAILQKNPKIGIVCSSFVEWDDRFPSETVQYEPQLNVDNPQVFSPSIITQVFWNTNFWIPGNTAITKRSHILKYGLFNSSFGHLCDWFLFHTIALYEGAAYIPSPLALFRKNNQSYSSQSRNHLVKKRMIEKNVIDYISLPENKELRRRFKQAGLFRFIIRNELIQLLKNPRSWDLLLSFLHRGISRKFKKTYSKEKLYDINHNPA